MSFALFIHNFHILKHTVLIKQNFIDSFCHFHVPYSFQDQKDHQNNEGTPIDHRKKVGWKESVNLGDVKNNEPKKAHRWHIQAGLEARMERYQSPYVLFVLNVRWNVCSIFAKAMSL